MGPDTKFDYRDEKIPPAYTPYALWARKLEENQEVDGKFIYLQPALIRLRRENRQDARRKLLELIETRRIRMDSWEVLLLKEQIENPDLPRQKSPGARSDETKSPDNPDAEIVYQIYWVDTDIDEIIERFGDLFDILELGRRVLAPRDLPETEEPPVLEPIDVDESTPIVAVIDDGIGFLNHRFCKPTKCDEPDKTRFHAIWVQAFRTITIPFLGKFYVHAGQEIYRPEIDTLLAEGDQLEEGAVYRALDNTLLEPGAHRSLEMGKTHGTHMLDVAAGAYPEDHDPVSDWPLLAVQLPPEAVDNTAGTQLEPCIIQGVRWILRQAELMTVKKNPVVINVSFATFAGPKDGTKRIEALIAEILATWEITTGRLARVIYSFGNRRLGRQVARFEMTESPQPIDWRIQPVDYAPSYLEIRPDDPTNLARFQVELTPPGSAVPLVLSPIAPNSVRFIIDPNGIVAAFFHIDAHFSAPGVITPAYYLLAVAPTAEEPASLIAPGGRWHLALSSTDCTCFPGRIEVQRGDTPAGYRIRGRQSYLDHPLAYEWDQPRQNWRGLSPAGPITYKGSHSSFVTAPSSQAFSAGAAYVDTKEPSPYSAEGAPWTIPGPTFGAIADFGPGLVGTVASGTYSGSGRTIAGTSVAAAQSTRSEALLLASGVIPPGPAPYPPAAEVTALIAAHGTPANPQYASRLGPGVVDDPDGGRQPR